MAIFKKTFAPQVDKLSFKDVAKKAGLTNLSSKKFKDQAVSVLQKSGMAQSAISGVLSGTRKVPPVTLKKVFKKLSEGKVIKPSKGSGVVTAYIKEEKARQTKIHNYKIALHKQDLAAEKTSEAPKEEQVKKGNQATSPQLSSGSVFSSSRKEEEPNGPAAETTPFIENNQLTESLVSPQSKGHHLLLEEDQLKKEEEDNQELPGPADMVID